MCGQHAVDDLYARLLRFSRARPGRWSRGRGLPSFRFSERQSSIWFRGTRHVVARPMGIKDDLDESGSKRIESRNEPLAMRARMCIADVLI